MFSHPELIKTNFAPNATAFATAMIKPELNPEKSVPEPVRVWKHVRVGPDNAQGVGVKQTNLVVTASAIC
jgi:hypothetical protein